MRAIFASQRWIDSMLEFEAALAGAQGRHGVLDSDSAAAITACCQPGSIDAAVLAQHALACGALADAVVDRLTESVVAQHAQAAHMVHFGVARQDLCDTAMMLRARDGLDLIARTLMQLILLLTQRAELHRHTVLAGRSGTVAVGPITFGLKISGWLDALLRHQDRLQRDRAEWLVLQLGGAGGTLAALGAAALPISTDVAEVLQLGLPDLPWHTQRDRVVELGSVLASLTASLGKMARDVVALMRCEVAELVEVASARGVAVAPVIGPACDATLAAAQQIPALVSTLLSATAHVHEGDPACWQVEAIVLPQLFILCDTALTQMRTVATALQTDVVRMRNNSESPRLALMSETLVVALAPAIGRAAARQLVHAASLGAQQSGKSLRAQLEQDETVTSLLGPDQLERLFQPAAHLGAASQFVTRVLQTQRQRQAAAAIDSPIVLPRVDNGEVHLHYQLEGQPGAPVLILANSLGTTLDVWAPQMPILLEHFRVLRFDARGHGQSSVPAGPYSIADMGTDVITLMDQLGIAQAHFCGLSMGGMIGIWLASHHRARIDRLVLCHTAATLPPPDSWNQRIALVEHSGMAAVAEEVVERWFTRDFQAHAVRQIGVVREILLQTSPVGYAASCAAVRDADLNDVLGDVQAPTLVIGGKHDHAVSPAQVRQLAGHLAHARYLELNAAHLSNWEVAQSFTSQVRDFLLGG